MNRRDLTRKLKLKERNVVRKILGTVKENGEYRRRHTRGKDNGQHFEKEGCFLWSLDTNEPNGIDQPDLYTGSRQGNRYGGRSASENHIGC